MAMLMVLVRRPEAAVSAAGDAALSPAQWRLTRPEASEC